MAGKTYFRPSANALAAEEQDAAAGGSAARRLRTRSGGIVTVSLALAKSGDAIRITMRFKSGGGTVQRTVGTVPASTPRAEALRLGWLMVREPGFVERDEWAWESPTT